MILRSHAESAATPARLWCRLSDVLHWPDILPTFSAVSPGGGSPVPQGVGARYHVRQPGLLPAVYEVTEWNAGESFTWASHTPGLSTTGTHCVRPSGRGSRLDLSLEWHGPLAPLVGLLLRGRVQRIIEVEARTLAGGGGIG